VETGVPLTTTYSELHVASIAEGTTLQRQVVLNAACPAALPGISTEPWKSYCFTTRLKEMGRSLSPSHNSGCPIAHDYFIGERE